MWEGGLAGLVPQAVVYAREHPAPEIRGEELLEEQDVWHASLRRRDVQGASVGVLESDNECRKEGWAVEDGGRPSRALSFSGSGFLVTYHLGVAECLLENMPEVVHGAPRVFGASAGSLIAAAVVCAVNLDNFYRSLKRAAKLSRRWFFGPMHPLFNLLRIVRKGLVENLPENAHELASGRLFISLTRVSDGQNVLVSDFTSNEELVQALVCSCFVPVYCGLVPPTFRGVHYIDGGFTNMQPLYDVTNTITISPFSGETDICPRDSADYFLLWFSNCSFVLSPENLHRVVLALFPPHSKILQRFVWNGYSDALHYLLQNNCGTHSPRGKHVPQHLEPEECSKDGSAQRVSQHKAWIFELLPTVRGQKMGIPGTFTRMATYPAHSVVSVAQRVKSWFLNIPKAFGLMSKNAESRRISG
ncbi:patatin-like phospholipase domain-containing protein 4 [Heterodontus francisci]|uniref:patatin-like phospholipase domain-containing protein 4 n=1 Tax=Heterodontus francisci TaxID=7792 RepID=UPI00355AE42F